MRKEYTQPAAEKVEFNYSENVTASTFGSKTINDNGYTWTLTNIDNDANGTYHGCGSSFKESAGITCGYNGKHTSNPNHKCGC